MALLAVSQAEWGPLPCFDGRVAGYDVARLPFLGALQAFSRRDLRTLVDDVEGVQHLQRMLCGALRAPPLRALIDRFVVEVLEPLAGAPLRVESYPNSRVVMPRSDGLCSAPHRDCEGGHRACERVVWIPLTPTTPSSTLWIAPLPAADGRGAQERLAPARVDVGEALLFTPLHLHGSFAHDDATNRVSIDFRVAPLGYDPHQPAFRDVARRAASDGDPTTRRAC